MSARRLARRALVAAGLLVALDQALLHVALADGWLAAYAKTHDCAVVTLEDFDPVIRKKVPLPNVCRAFDVEPITPFEMLRRERARFVLGW